MFPDNWMIMLKLNVYILFEISAPWCKIIGVGVSALMTFSRKQRKTELYIFSYILSFLMISASQSKRWIKIKTLFRVGIVLYFVKLQSVVTVTYWNELKLLQTRHPLHLLQLEDQLRNLATKFGTLSKECHAINYSHMFLNIYTLFNEI
jgi:hypothetical protein